MNEKNERADRSEYITATDDGVRIRLRKPIKDNGGVLVTHLDMREPTVADQLVVAKAKGVDAEKELVMIANLCELSPDTLKSLTMFDYVTVQQAFMDFVG